MSSVKVWSHVKVELFYQGGSISTLKGRILQLTDANGACRLGAVQCSYKA